MPISISGLSKDDLRPEKRPIRVAYKSGGDVEEREIRKLSSEEESDMLMAGLNEIEYSGKPETAVGRHMSSMGVPEFLTGNDDGYIDSQGMPQRRSATDAPAPRSVFEAVLAINDENFKEHEETFNGDGFGGGDKGNEAPLEDQDQGMSIISETRSQGRRQRRASDPLETFVSSPVDDIQSKEHDTQHQFQERDDHGVYDRDINQNGEDPNRVVPEHFNEGGSWPMPGETQDFTAEPVKDIDIMAGVKVTLTDGREIIGRILSEDRLNMNVRGRLAGMQSDVSFPVLKTNIANVEKVRIRPKVARTNSLEDVYATIKTKTAGEKKMINVNVAHKRSAADSLHDLYQKFVDAGCEMDTHESDLYVKVTPESQAIVDGYEYANTVPTFISNIDQEKWFDIPFGNKPFWDAKTGVRKAESKDAKDGSQARVDNTRGPGMLFGDDAALYDQLDKRTKALAAQASEIKRLIAIADKLDEAGQEVNAAKADAEIQRRHAIYKKEEAIVDNLKKLIATRKASRRTAAVHMSPVAPAVTPDPDHKNVFTSKLL
jgi:hypothetical protein